MDKSEALNYWILANFLTRTRIPDTITRCHIQLVTAPSKLTIKRCTKARESNCLLANYCLGDNLLYFSLILLVFVQWSLLHCKRGEHSFKNVCVRYEGTKC